ncbi:MAG: DUF2489 domain-containing protein [Pseudomonadota bacterium]|jgi:ABC-type uncharacterized transport system permease subunit|nr:hypothetical protein [Porticoccaceae bacterium]MCH2560095.1 DUF2489 domain-containing protein [Pseudomonadales bacterium]MEC7158383.1 DUF2489 domain-containing protein [Pseudomonadota bacterium]MAL67502.1 hypothetical protein [Porticoccaceae bacterium]MBE64191.1 hypothetical protein [Porticoccaceae bacterium]|tara:strand:+ start:3640 stop:4089 length:450 start_codon:yes stop_codon:yes gene_type:complete
MTLGLIISIGSIFFCPLLIYYLYLLKKINKKSSESNYLQVFDPKVMSDARRSIKLILLAYQQGSVSAVETSMRISFLLKTLDFDDKIRRKFDIFDEVSAKSAHIPILEQWDNLEKKTKFQYEREIKKIDNDYRLKLQDASADILATIEL